MSSRITLEPGMFTAWNLRGYAADLSKLLPRLCAEFVATNTF